MGTSNKSCIIWIILAILGVVATLGVKYYFLATDQNMSILEEMEAKREEIMSMDSDTVIDTYMPELWETIDRQATDFSGRVANRIAELVIDRVAKAIKRGADEGTIIFLPAPDSGN